MICPMCKKECKKTHFACVLSSNAGKSKGKCKARNSEKMRKAALLSALSSKMVDKSIVGLSGLDKASGKTKEMVKLLSKVTGKGGNVSSLIVTGEKIDNVVRGVRNIPGVSISPANLINAYEVLKHDILMLTKDAVEKLTKPQKEQK